MPAKRKPARRTTTSRARSTATRRRTTTTRKKTTTRVRVPRSGPIHARLGAWMALKAADQIVTHKDTVRARQDAAILRATHEGCTKCGGNGQIFTKGKDGSFTGSKPCPASPTKKKVSKWAIYKSSRFGEAKKTGLVGCSCPCGWKQKPRFRDAKEATKALRTHEKAKHGGKTVGGAWYAQASEAAIQVAPVTIQKKKAAPKGRPPAKSPRDISDHEIHRPPSPYDPNDPLMEHRRKPVSSDPDEKNQHSGLTDHEWVTQDKDRKAMPGECPKCFGTTYRFVLNADATTDYDRQVVIRCGSCTGGRVAA
ncbi:hypothetical protein [Streptomyces sp. NPDC002853]